MVEKNKIKRRRCFIVSNRAKAGQKAGQAECIVSAPKEIAVCTVLQVGVTIQVQRPANRATLRIGHIKRKLDRLVLVDCCFHLLPCAVIPIVERDRQRQPLTAGERHDSEQGVF